MQNQTRLPARQVPKNWQKVKLNDLGFVGRGKSKHRPRNDSSLYGGEYPFIQTSDVKNTNLYITDYSQTYNHRGLLQSKLWDPGTLLITIAANIAETAILKISACFPDSIVGFIADPKKSDTRFVKYYIDIIKLNMQSASKGTTQDNLSLDKLLTFDFFVPEDVGVQRKIAFILSAYDDLIENNNKQIQILEEMARAIYKEWFVHFRFPGYEKVKIIDSPLGKIPEGWNSQPMGKILNYHIGGGWGSEKAIEQYQIPAYVIRGTDIPSARYGSVNRIPLRYHKKTNFQSRQLIDKDIVFEVSGGSKDQPVGRALFINQTLLNQFKQNVICASFCKLLRVNKNILPPEITYLHLIEIYESGKIYQYQVQSTGISNFKFESFINKEIVLIPDKETKNQFSEIIEPLFNQIQMLGSMNTSLRQARDLLLPKLMRGEVRI